MGRGADVARIGGKRLKPILTPHGGGTQIGDLPDKITAAPRMMGYGVRVYRDCEWE